MTTSSIACCMLSILHLVLPLSSWRGFRRFIIVLSSTRNVLKYYTVRHQRSSQYSIFQKLGCPLWEDCFNIPTHCTRVLCYSTTVLYYSLLDNAYQNLGGKNLGHLVYSCQHLLTQLNAQLINENCSFKKEKS